MGRVVLQGEVLELEIEQGRHRRIEPHGGQGPGIPAQLQPGRLEVVLIEVGVAKGVDELSRVEPADLGHHHGQEGVGGDVERNAQEHVGAPLIQLAGETALGNVELEEGMAGSQGHHGNLGDIPGADDEPPAVGVGSDLVEDQADLIDVPAIGRGPGTPLTAVDRAQIARFIRPLIPDRHAVVVEIPDVGIPLRNHRSS